MKKRHDGRTYIPPIAGLLVEKRYVEYVIVLLNVDRCAVVFW
jgi:hypothetical protein